MFPIIQIGYEFDFKVLYMGLRHYVKIFNRLDANPNRISLNHKPIGCQVYVLDK